MWPVKPTMDIWWVEPATYKKICSDKNCQYTRCCKKKSPVRPVCDDKNCQSSKTMYYRKCQVNSARTQSTHMWSVPKTACHQIGTQPEIPRNINSASKSCCSSQTTKVSLDDRSLKIQSNHRCYKMQSPQKRSKNPMKIQSYSMWPVKAELSPVQKPQVQSSKYKRDTKT